jgi:hypothetical protein
MRKSRFFKTHPDILSGEVRDFLNIHNPKKKQSTTGSDIIKWPIQERPIIQMNRNYLNE